MERVVDFPATPVNTGRKAGKAPSSTTAAMAEKKIRVDQ
jgi:hypothetical protein